MIGFAAQRDIQRARLIDADSKRLHESKIADFDRSVFGPMGQSGACKLQVAGAGHHRLAAFDDMIPKEPVRFPAEYGAET